MLSTGPPAIALAYVSFQEASRSLGSFGGLGVRVEVVVRSVQVWPLLGQPQQRLQASVTAAGRSAALPRPRSCCLRVTPTSMETVMEWRANP